MPDRRSLLTLPLALAVLALGGATQRSVAATQGDFEITVASGADPVSLDPRKTWVGQGYSINAHVFEPLVFRREQNGNVVLVPILAESWTQTSPTTLEIKVRKGIKFQNGEDLDAAAAAYTITSIMDPKFVTNLKLWTGDIAAVDVKDQYTLVITTKYQTRGLLNSLAQISIVAPKAAQAPDFEKHPIGTGPYRIVSYAPSSQTLLERFDGYWGTPGKAKRITFRIMPENSVRIAALEAGEVQVAENLPPDKLETLRANSEVKVLFTPTLRVDYLVLNFRNPLVGNRKFREALSLAIDRDALVKNLLAGTTKVANSISPPGTIGYDGSLAAYPYDAARAKELLKDAGYNGEPITMGGPVGRYSMDKQINEAIAGMFRAIGINLKFEALAWASYYPKYAAGGYDIGFLGLTDFTVNPPKHWGPIFYSKTGTGKYNNPDMDKIIDTGEQELDDAKAVALFRQGQALQHDDLGALPLYYEPQLIGVSSKLSGFAPRLDEYLVLREAEVND